MMAAELGGAEVSPHLLVRAGKLDPRFAQNGDEELKFRTRSAGQTHGQRPHTGSRLGHETLAIAKPPLNGRQVQFQLTLAGHEPIERRFDGQQQ